MVQAQHTRSLQATGCELQVSGASRPDARSQVQRQPSAGATSASTDSITWAQ
jgi:hypothetical protein